MEEKMLGLISVSFLFLFLHKKKYFELHTFFGFGLVCMFVAIGSWVKQTIADGGRHVAGGQQGDNGKPGETVLITVLFNFHYLKYYLKQYLKHSHFPYNLVNS